MKLVLLLSLLVATPALAADPPPAKAKADKAEKKAPPPPPADKPADKPAADKPAAKPVMSAQEAKQVEAFFDDLFAAVVKTQTDCPKMGPAINGVLDKHAALIEKSAGSDKEPPPALKAKMEKKQTEFVNALMKCGSDAGVKASLERMTKMAAKK